MVNIAENLSNVRLRIAAACEKAGRVPDDVKIIAVTKYASLAETEEILRLGLSEIGESRVQAGVAKKASIPDNNLHWHLIGNLQSNKVNKALETFSYIHSIDRLSIVQQLNRRAALRELKIKCFIQVNISKETTKSGIEVEQIFPFIEEMVCLDNVEIVGLMTMAPHFSDQELTRPIFSKLRELRDEINKSGILEYELKELSMGMSNDFEVAIEEGSTYIRIGSSLFK